MRAKVSHVDATIPDRLVLQERRQQDGAFTRLDSTGCRYFNLRTRPALVRKKAAVCQSWLTIDKYLLSIVSFNAILHQQTQPRVSAARGPKRTFTKPSEVAWKRTFAVRT
jgi:hypothetical protein